MTDFRLVGVPFDGYGRAGRQAAAPDALRAAGIAMLPGVVDTGSLTVPPGTDRRGGRTSFVNEDALESAVRELDGWVGDTLRSGTVPIVVGGDCSLLLGIVPAARRAAGAGLVFIDGHEDTMPLDVSDDGEAANCEIGLLLGITGGLLRGPLRDAVGVLPRDRLAVLGTRDEGWRRQFNVGSVRDQGVFVRDVHEVRADVDRVAGDGVRAASAGASWWLHVDVDVLDPVEFAAQGFPHVEDEPGGLSVDELTELVASAAGRGGCVGVSIAVFDPEQDPEQKDARAIVELVRRVLPAVSGLPDRPVPC